MTKYEHWSFECTKHIVHGGGAALLLREDENIGLNVIETCDNQKKKFYHMRKEEKTG
jgi:hypothetical protein